MRMLAVPFTSVLCWHAAMGQPSTYVDLRSSGSTAQALQTKPLTISQYPTTFSAAVSEQRTHLRTIDVAGKVWQWQLGPSLKPELILTTHAQPTCAVLSPTAKLLAYADSQGSVTLMDLDSRRVRFRDNLRSTNTVALCFSARGNLLASADRDGLVRVWNVTSGNTVNEFRAPSSAIQSLAFAPDDSTLAVASFSPELRLFDMSDESEPRDRSEPRVISLDESRITAIAFTPDAQHIVITAANGTALVQEIGNPQQRRWLDSYPFAIWSLAFDQGGQRMFAGSWDGTIRIWDTDSWQIIQNLKEHQESVSAMILGEQGMISVGLDGRLLFWPPQVPGIKPKGMIKGPADPVWVATYSPDGQRLVLGGRGDRLEMWDAKNLRLLYNKLGHPTTRCAAFSPDGKTVATGGDDHTIMLWSAEDGKTLHRLMGHRGAVSAVLFVDDGRTLISGCDRGLLKFWDTQTGEELCSHRRHEQQLYCARVSPDHKWLLTGGGHWAKGDPGELIVWDLAKREFKARLAGHRLTVWSIMFSPNGDYFATSDSAGEVKLWNTRTFEEIRTLHHPTWVRPLAVSPDGTTLAVGRGDGSIRLWDTTTWTETGACNGHDSFTFWLQYSPDGKTLATSGNDGTVRFWETRSGRLRPSTPR